MACSREGINNHHLGTGYGRVGDGETLVYAVFDSETMFGERLRTSDFDTKAFLHGNVSLARTAYTTRKDFENNILAPKTASSSKFCGVSSAKAADLRSIKRSVSGPQPPPNFRGFCLLDKVELGDMESHAALQTCKEQQGLTAKQKGSFRAALAADLCDAFGVVGKIEQVTWCASPV